jgi:hypothetical protein
MSLDLNISPSFELEFLKLYHSLTLLAQDSHDTASSPFFLNMQHRDAFQLIRYLQKIASFVHKSYLYISTLFGPRFFEWLKKSGNHCADSLRKPLMVMVGGGKVGGGGAVRFLMERAGYF